MIRHALHVVFRRSPCINQRIVDVMQDLICSFSIPRSSASLAITKLDGTAKGGVVIGISDQLKVPVKFIGLGEKMEDLQLFDRKEFVDSLFK